MPTPGRRVADENKSREMKIAVVGLAGDSAGCLVDWVHTQSSPLRLLPAS